MRLALFLVFFSSMASAGTSCPTLNGKYQAVDKDRSDRYVLVFNQREACGTLEISQDSSLNINPQLLFSISTDDLNPFWVNANYRGGLDFGSSGMIKSAAYWTKDSLEVLYSFDEKYSAPKDFSLPEGSSIHCHYKIESPQAFVRNCEAFDLAGQKIGQAANRFERVKEENLFGKVGEFVQAGIKDQMTGRVIMRNSFMISDHFNQSTRPDSLNFKGCSDDRPQADLRQKLRLILTEAVERKIGESMTLGYIPASQLQIRSLGQREGLSPAETLYEVKFTDSFGKNYRIISEDQNGKQVNGMLLASASVYNIDRNTYSVKKCCISMLSETNGKLNPIHYLVDSDTGKTVVNLNNGLIRNDSGMACASK